MQRREFLKVIPGIAFLLMDAKKAIARAFPGLFPDYLTLFPPNSRQSLELPIRWQQDVAFVDARRLAESLKYNTYFNDERKKLVLYLPQNKVVITANNPFVIIDDRTLQMPVSCKIERNDIFLPLSYWVPLVNQYANINLNYDEKQQILQFGDPRFNVAGVDVDARENGVVIRIRTAKKFQKGEMSIDKRNNWLHVDLYGATADINSLARNLDEGPVREMKAFQFATLLSVAFRLRTDPISREVYQDENTGEVVAILRYREQLAESETAEKQPEKAEEARVENDRQTPEKEDDIRKQLEEERQRWLIDTVVIDPGHGGKDPGAIGVGGLKEKDVVLSIGLKLGELIERRMPGVKVIYTRKDDTFVELRQRTQIANENQAKLFISIHANANKSSSPAGFETYLLGATKGAQASAVAERENAVIRFESSENQAHYKGINAILAGLAQTAFMKQSEHLASNVQTQIGKRMQSLNMKDRGVKQAGFWVMVGASMPCVLVETGFITNRYDAKILKTNSHQQKIAEGIFAGLQQFKTDHENSI